MTELVHPFARWRLINSDALTPPTRWANGAGWTTELIPRRRSQTLSGPGTPQWRLSVARLDAACAFSTLPGIRRTFMPVGKAVRLEVAGELIDVEPLQPVHFAGDDPVRLVELRKPCHAVNLMVDDTHGTVDVALHGPGPLHAGVIAVIPRPSDVGGHFEAWAAASQPRLRPGVPRIIGQLVRSTTHAAVTPLDEGAIILGYN